MKTAWTFFIATVVYSGIGCTQKFDVNGTYETDFGTLILQEKEKKVTGTYSYPGANREEAKGSLQGELKEHSLDFTWEQVQGRQKASGSGRFTFADDGKKFTGTWEDSFGKTGSWNGTKK